MWVGWVGESTPREVGAVREGVLVVVLRREEDGENSSLEEKKRKGITTQA